MSWKFAVRVQGSAVLLNGLAPSGNFFVGLELKPSLMGECRLPLSLSQQGFK